MKPILKQSSFKIAVFLLILLFLFILSFSLEAAQVHRVAPGENLYLLAGRYGVTVNEIINTNNLRYPEKIMTKQVLIIPDINRPEIYRVKEGDTLYKISQKLAIPMGIIADTNGLSSRDELHVKQPLYIPTRYRYPQSHQIQAGDTLYHLARDYGVTTKELIIFNQLASITLEIGQTIKIPALKPREPSKSPGYSIKYPGILYYRGISNDYQVALTFDDGPDKFYTPRILDILREYQVPATFFVVGSNVNLYPEVIKRILREGHILASHSWSHINLGKASKEQIISEFKETEKAVREITGLKMRFFRPPWGFVKDEVLDTAINLDYKIVNWAVDSRDWDNQQVDQLLINTLPNIQKDSIILFHSTGGRNGNLEATVKVLPELIETLQMNGYTIVSLEELLNTPAYGN